MLTVLEAAELLRRFDHVLILTHVRPDGDTVGCAAALCAALRALGKTAYLLPNPGLTDNTAPYFAPYAAPEGFVPETDFFLWEDNHIVGMFRIRHFLNDFLREGAGHIGYGIKKEYRGKGYASRGLAQALEEARRLVKEDEIYMSVNRDNPASLRVQEKNGAYIHHMDDKEYYTRIKIK